MPEKTYRYTTKFESTASIVKINNDKKQLAVASLQNLAGVFSDETIEKIKTNPDLLFISSNLIELNACNLNDDAVLGEDLFKIDKCFELKFLDTEHDRSQVVGVITDVGYSLLSDSAIISKEAAMELNGKEPVCLVIGGCVWKLVAKDLANAIELASAQESYKISTSFELLFDCYDIAVGANGEKDALKARIIKEGEPDFVKYDAILKRNGGSGMEGDDIVYRILKGDIIPAGAGIVAKPASGIKGVLSLDREDLENKAAELEQAVVEAIGTDSEQPVVESAAIQEIFVKNEETSVNPEILSLTNMHIELKTIEDVTAKWDDLVKNEASASAQSIGEFITAKIAERSAEYGKELAEKENAISEARASYQAAQDKIKELDDCVSALSSKLKEIQDNQAAGEAEAKFNARMSEVDDTFDLDEDDRAMLCDEVKGAVSDESYATWLDKKKKLLKEKTRSFKQKQSEALKEKFAKANVTAKFDENMNLEEVFASVTPLANESTLPNSSESNEDIKTKMHNAFSDGIEVNGVSAKEFLKKK